MDEECGSIRLSDFFTRHSPNKPQEQVHHRPGVPSVQAPVSISGRKHTSNGNVCHEDSQITDAKQQPDQQCPTGPGAAKERYGKHVEYRVKPEKDTERDRLWATPMRTQTSQQRDTTVVLAWEETKRTYKIFLWPDPPSAKRRLLRKLPMIASSTTQAAKCVVALAIRKPISSAVGMSSYSSYSS